jgi:hypothetical protein
VQKGGKVMAKKVKIDGLADAVMKELEEYADVIDTDMRKAVTKAGQTVRKDISANAPKRHGDYAKSWSTKKTRQTARSLEVTVYSRNRYQLAHLLEHGHAKRGGGRTRAQVHIAPAEEKGIRQLEEDIKRSIRHG